MQLSISVLGAAKTDQQVMAVELSLDPKRIRRTKAKVNVIPEDRRVAALFGERSGDDPRMSVAFDDVQAAVECRVVKRV